MRVAQNQFGNVYDLLHTFQMAGITWGAKSRRFLSAPANRINRDWTVFYEHIALNGAGASLV